MKAPAVSTYFTLRQTDRKPARNSPEEPEGRTCLSRNEVPYVERLSVSLYISRYI